MAKPEKIRPQKSKLATVSLKTLVKFTRPTDKAGSTTGYVLGRGPRFFLLALVSDDLRLNGFNCLRYQDVRQLQSPARYATFVESALRLRGERVPPRPKVNLSRISQLLLTAGRVFPLVTIHREKINPGTCNIGRVLAVDEQNVTLLEIGPGALWDAKPRIYRTSEITRVDFGGSYEEALLLVGGSPAQAGLFR